MDQRTAPYLAAFGAAATFDGPARNVLAAEMRFAEQYRIRLSASIGEEIPARDFAALFEAHLMLMTSFEERPTMSAVQRRTLDAVAHAFHGLGIPYEVEPQWSVDYVEDEISVRGGAITLMCQQRLLSCAIHLGEPIASSPEIAAGIAHEINQRAVNHLISRGMDLSGVSSHEVLEAIDRAIDDALTPQNEDIVEERIRDAARAFGLDFANPAYASRTHEMNAMLSENPWMERAARAGASALAVHASSRGFDAEATWDAAYRAIGRSFFSTHLGRPAFDAIPEVSSILNTGMFGPDEDPDAAGDIMRLHAGLVPYVGVINALNGSLILGDGPTMLQSAEDLVNAVGIRGLIHDESGTVDADTLLIDIEDVVDELLGSDENDDDFDIGDWREHAVESIADMDDETMDHVFTTGSIRPMPPMTDTFHVFGALAACGQLSESAARRMRAAMTFLPGGSEEIAMPGRVLWAIPEPVEISVREANAAAKAMTAPSGIRYGALMIFRDGDFSILLNDGRRTQLLDIDPGDFAIQTRGESDLIH